MAPQKTDNAFTKQFCTDRKLFIN